MTSLGADTLWSASCPSLLMGGGRGGGGGEEATALLPGGQNAAGEHECKIILKNFPNTVDSWEVSSCNFLHPRICPSQGQSRASMLLRGEMWNTSPCSPISLLAVSNASVHPRLLVFSLGRPLCVSALLLWGRIPVSSRSRPLAALCSQTLGPLHSGGARQSTALLRPPGQPLPCGPCSSSGSRG